MAVFNHTKHKELWNWLADNPGKRKSDWPGWKDCNASNECFACEATKLFIRNCGTQCPLDWGTKGNGCARDGSPYDKWSELTAKVYLGKINPEELEKRKEMIRDAALAIARLPLREIEGLEVI